MKRNKLTVLISLLTGIICSGYIVSPSTAGTTKILGVKVTHYMVSASNFSVGDEEGHFVGIGQREGEAAFDNGETARYSNVFTFDARRGKVLPSKGYSKFIFNDGSWFALSWEAETTIDNDGLLFSKGQGTIISGAGRYKGIIGGAVFSGKELKPASQDPRRTAVMDATITCTLP